MQELERDYARCYHKKDSLALVYHGGLDIRDAERREAIFFK